MRLKLTIPSTAGRGRPASAMAASPAARARSRTLRPDALENSV